jgi:hypothetical protein
MIWKNSQLPSRRDLFGMGSAAGALTLIAKPDYAQSMGTKSSHESSEENVRTFGAVGDAVTDDSAAFQRALDTVSRVGAALFMRPWTLPLQE